MSPALKKTGQRYLGWLFEQALPLWSHAPVDPEGGFYEDLDLSGYPRKDSIRRVRVQPRQAYVFAHAAILGWPGDARRFSDHGFDYLLSAAAQSDPLDTNNFDGFVHRLTPEGDIAVPQRDSYDHAFVLLAGAWRYMAFAEERSLKIAEATLGFLDRVCGAEMGSFTEGFPPSLPRRQNPHMHLFEAFLALHRASGDSRYLDRASLILDLLRERFINADGYLLEFFDHDLKAPDVQKGHLVEPGHMMEWCWLLDQYEQATGKDMGDISDRFYALAELSGKDPKSGFLVDCISLNDTPPPAPSRRTWVQTEYIKATLVRARKGSSEMADKAAGLLELFCGSYLSSSVPGGYIDQYDGNGNVISDAMPTSTLYHLMSLGAELDKTVQQ